MEKNISSSLKWSTYGEISSKLISPIMNMILARILVPEDFGVLASIMMVITFADILTDSGFAKYVIQNDFKYSDFDNYLNVAFWTNFLFSTIIFICIFIFGKEISNLIGSEGHELAISISSFQLLLTSFSSIQTAWLRRNFEFKKIFICRIISTIIPLIVTLPLAVVLRNYWAMIIGNLMVQLINTILLIYLSDWFPKFYYSFNLLTKMISFSSWSLAEAIVFWLISWFDIFIIGSTFSAFYLGIYKNSLNTVNALMNLVKASIIPVLFSALSRTQTNSALFKKIYFDMQLLCASILIPLGLGVFLYRDLATLIIFGNNWVEATNIIGAWSLSMCVMSVFVNFYGEALKAKGFPKILFIYEVICLVLMIALAIFAKNIGFWVFVYTRSASVVIQVLVGFIYMKKYLEFSYLRMIKNIFPPLISSLIMAVFCSFFRYMTDNIILLFISICCAAVLYFVSYYLLFKDDFIRMLSLIKHQDNNIYF